MKNNLLLFIVLFLHIATQAAPVDLKKAQLVATHFWMANGGSPDVEWVDLTSQTPFSEFSILANANGNGFIIISGDDCVIPVLAYSLDNEFNPKMPAHIVEYLNGMNQEIAFCKAHNVESTAELASLWTSLTDGRYAPNTTTTVDPLLTTTWDQGDYYNEFCPASEGMHTLTGCVATATAQIMKYWEWPSTGTGSYSYYQSPFGVLSANFGNTTYQWLLMPDALNQSSSQAQIDAVATLMYHVGVGVKMDYGFSGSAAYLFDSGIDELPCPKYALTHYFDYQYTMHNVYKPNVTDSAWCSIIREELDAGRPILHGGRSGTGSFLAGGHAFVCDGYDNNNLFHFNWGWGGYCDGYYAANDLNPATHDFNYARGIVVGIEPNDPNTIYYTITVIPSDYFMGSVSGEGMYAEGTAVTIRAVPYNGYCFKQWNDGDTTNPRIVTVTGDATYTAIFQEAVGIEDVTKDDIRVYAHGKDIHVVHAENRSVDIYDIFGKLLFSENANPSSNSVFTVETKGIYIVKVNNRFANKVVVGE